MSKVVELTEDLAKCRRVAVYGTLRSEYHNNRLLRGARLIDIGTSEFWGTMYSCGGFPILCTAEPSTKVVVEIWELPEGTDGDVMLDDLDRLEGYPGWYDRTIKTFAINGEPIKAWIYTQDNVNMDLPEVESGDWKQYVESNRV